MTTARIYKETIAAAGLWFLAGLLVMALMMTWFARMSNATEAPAAASTATA